MKNINVGILGGTGYTGAELLRLLVCHPNVDLTVVASRSEAGRLVSDLFPNLRGFTEVKFSTPSVEGFAECDLVFSATPNGIAMNYAPDLINQGVRLIDLAADFRLKDIPEWEKWYSQKHACPDMVTEAVYGLPELNRDLIAEAKVVANPGCYPTATTLGFLPLLKNGLVEIKGLISDSKSGVSGAGRGASVATLFSEVNDSFKAYAVSAHRHHPEISQTLSQIAKEPVDLTFIPHLLPITRGIHATLYADLKPGVDLGDVQDAFLSAYENEPFVDVMELGSHPETRSVKSSNLCRIAIHQATGSGKLIVLSVIDNLNKGAAGQALQNMNIMFGLDECLGLASPGLMP